jgi:hypothetical protein
MMRDQEGGLHDHGRFRMLGGLHPKSEVPDQPISSDRRLAFEWTTGL